MTLLSAVQCAKLMNVTKWAIKAAIRNERLPALKNGDFWYIHIDDLQKYIKEKHNRDCSKFNGQPLYDKQKGEYSVHQAAKLLNCSYHHIYYACRKEKIRSFRKNSTWVINIDDLENYRKIMKVRKRSKDKNLNLLVGT